MPQLRVAITKIIGGDTLGQTQGKPQGELMTKSPLKTNQATNYMLLAVSIGRKTIVIKMKIMRKMSNSIINKGSRVNVLPEETWNCLGKPTLWTNLLLGRSLPIWHKSLGTLMEK